MFSLRRRRVLWEEEEEVVVVKKSMLVVKAFRIGGSVLGTAMPTQTKKGESERRGVLSFRRFQTSNRIYR